LDDFKQEHFLNFLTENLHIFHTLCEEDPEYQGVEILQNGINFSIKYFTKCLNSWNVAFEWLVDELV
jgi:hypothetical protein